MKKIEVIFNPFTRDLVLFIDGKEQPKRDISMDSWVYYELNENDDIAIQFDTDEATTLTLNLRDIKDKTLYTVSRWSSDGVGSFYDKSEIGRIKICNSVVDFNAVISEMRKKSDCFINTIITTKGVNVVDSNFRKINSLHVPVITSLFISKLMKMGYTTNDIIREHSRVVEYTERLLSIIEDRTTNGEEFLTEIINGIPNSYLK